ncbi:alpha-2-macroglobulin-like [Fundulus diaphanus]
MGHPRNQMWIWMLWVFSSGMCVGSTVAKPHYMVTIPAILEAGAETKFCASLNEPNETLTMTVTLGSEEKNTTLHEKTSREEFLECIQFQVPFVENEEITNFEVEVRGNTFYSKEVRKVLIKAYQPMHFIQTDKPIYLPGQTVHFRVVSLDTKFRPTNQLYSIIELEDPYNNRIGQWLNETSNSKILQLSYPLNSEVREGTYNIILKMDKTGCSLFEFKMSSFTKIDSKVAFDGLDLSATMEEEGTSVSLSQKKKVQISYIIGKLTFIDPPKIYDQGSNLEGKVKAVHYNDTPMSHMPVYLFEGHVWSATLLQNLTTDSDGFATFSVSTDTFSQDIRLSITTTPVMEYSPYRTVYIQTGNHVVQRSLPPSSDTKSVSSLKIKTSDATLPCDQEVDIIIDYTFVHEPQGSVDIMYQILSRGTIGSAGQKQVEVEDKPVNEGEVSIRLNVSPDMAPVIQVVAYAVLPSESVIAHNAEFSTEKCFSNKVSLEFSPSSAVPGEDTKLQLTAQPDSLCGVSAIDQSVLIKEPGQTLDEDRIFQMLPVRKHSFIPYQVEDPIECVKVRTKRYLPYVGEEIDPRIFFQNVGLKTVTNLVIGIPNCVKFKGRVYHRGIYGERGIQVTRMNSPVAMALDVGSSPPMDSGPVETVRKFFPETWIFDLVEIGSSGTKEVSLTVPDTITTWETETFCLSPQGFGLAPRQKLTVFQPFFLELTLPYSIIRGENFELKATVFNYLTKCIMVKVTAADSSDYSLSPLSGDQYTSCLCTNERKTLSWTMTPTALGVVNVTVTAEAVPSHASCDNEIVSIPDRGRIDVVTRPLIVKAEGVEVTKTHNWLVCPKGEALTEETELLLPQNVIDGSGRTAVSVLGDILGRALQNLDGLLQMPYGCGEQNMALLAPNIYIIEYLQSSQQLTPAIKAKASNFLTSGYQRQLNYKDSEGAYSTFGTGPGNTWLTAFVLRAFSKAQSFIYIDPEKLEQSKTWLIQKQRKTGCFQQSGKLFNNRMKGGVSDEVTLSAYITTAFLEMKMASDDSVVKQSLSCLKESVNDFSNTYTTALLAYVFTLAGDMETRAHLLQHLDSVAIKDGGFIHWSQTATEKSASLSVEISSYVLLAKLSTSHTTEDRGYASGIVRWLTTQQNHYGGFSSTQDTVVALQALSLYSSLVFSPEGSSTVTVQSPSGQLVFDVNPENKLLYQEKMLQDVTGKYSLEVKGSACASVQISQHYNIPPPPDATTMSVEVLTGYNSSHTPAKVTLMLSSHFYLLYNVIFFLDFMDIFLFIYIMKLLYKFRLFLHRNYCITAYLLLCSRYNGKEGNTNMVILDIALLSGFIPDPQSLKNLEHALLVDRVEYKNSHVIVYLQGLTKGLPVNHSLVLLQQVPVQNLKPAVIALYDYYQPTDRADREYIVANQAANNIQATQATVQPAANNAQATQAPVQPAANNTQATQATVQPAANNTQVTQATVQPAANNTQATQAPVQPAANNTQATQATVQPAANNTQATQATVQPAANNTQATQATVQPAANDTQATQATVQPAANNIQATQATVQPAANNTQATQATVQPAANNTQATQATVQPAANTTQATQATVQPAANNTQATQATVQPAANNIQATQATVQPAANNIQATQTQKNLCLKLPSTSW